MPSRWSRSAEESRERLSAVVSMGWLFLCDSFHPIMSLGRRMMKVRKTRLLQDLTEMKSLLAFDAFKQ